MSDPYRVMYLTAGAAWSTHAVGAAATRDAATAAARRLVRRPNVVKAQVQEWNRISLTYKVVRVVRG